MAVRAHKYGPMVHLGRHIGLFTGVRKDVGDVKNPLGVSPALMRDAASAEEHVEGILNDLQAGRRPDWLIIGRPHGTPEDSLISADSGIRLTLRWADLPVPSHCREFTKKLIRAAAYNLSMPTHLYIGPELDGEVMDGGKLFHRRAFREEVAKVLEIGVSGLVIDTAWAVRDFDAFVEIGEAAGIIVTGEGCPEAMALVSSPWLARATRGPKASDFHKHHPFRERARMDIESPLAIGIGWNEGVETDEEIRQWAERGWRDFVGWTKAGWLKLCELYPEPDVSDGGAGTPAPAAV